MSPRASGAYAPMPMPHAPPWPHAPMLPSPYAPPPCVHAPIYPRAQVARSPNPRFPIRQTIDFKPKLHPPPFFFLSFRFHAFHSRMRVCMRNSGCPRPSRPIPAAEIAVFGNYFRSRTRAWPLFPSKFSQVGRRPSKVAFLCKSALRGQVLWRKYAEGVIGRCWARGRPRRLAEIIVENRNLKCRFGNNLRVLTSGAR